MKIDLDLKEMMENCAEDLVAFAISEAPYDTFDLHTSIKAGNFNPSDNSIEVFVDTGELGNNHPNLKPWNGMYYPEIVHKGHKTRLKPGGRGKAFVAAIPFFQKALEKIDISKYGVTFRIIET